MMPPVSPKQPDPTEADVMSALPRTRPHRSTARRTAARESAATPAKPSPSRPRTAKPRAPKPQPTPAPPAGYSAPDDKGKSAPAPVEVVRGAIEGVVKGLRSRMPFLPKH